MLCIRDKYGRDINHSDFGLSSPADDTKDDDDEAEEEERKRKRNDPNQPPPTKWLPLS